MQSLGDQLLAGSALALQKDRGAAGSNLRYQVENLQHGLALAHDVFKVVTLLQSALELNVFCFSLVAAYCDAHIRQQLFIVPRFLDEVGGAGLHRLHRIFHRAIGGDHDHGKLWIMSVKLYEQVQTVAIRQCQVKQHQVKRMFPNPRQTLISGCRRFNRIAFQLQQSLKRLADRSFVVDDQHGAGRCFVQHAAWNCCQFRH